MPVTRSPDFPEEGAQIVHAFSRMCDGLDGRVAVQAAANILAMAINAYARMAKMTDEQRASFADDVVRTSRKLADNNWKRMPRPTDIPVKPQ